MMGEAADAGKPFNIAILDRNMPGMDGLTLARKIRGAEHLRDTRLIMRTLRNTERVMHNPVVDKVLEIEGRGNTQIEEIIPYVSGLVGKEMLENGKMDKGILAAGQTMGFVKDIPTCKELLDRIMDQAERFERSGQAGFLIQSYTPTDRSLRVVAIGGRLITYWRVSNFKRGSI